MRLIQYLLFFGFLIHLSAQSTCDRNISGRILDVDTKEPLPFATIKINDSEQGAVSDAEGYFTLVNVCREEVDLEVQFVGYKKVIHHHDFHHENPTIMLAPEETLLESIVIEQELNAHEIKSIASKKVKVNSISSIGSNVGDLLAESSGVSVLKTGQNVVKPILHGLHSNRVLIINNEVRHANQAWGDDHGLEIDVNQIDQIEVIKGASTVRYGADALGGVILFDAPSPSYSSELSGTVNGGFETNGGGFSGELSLTEGYDRMAWQASVSGSRFGDLHAPNYQLTNTGRKELGFSFGGKYHLPTIDLDLLISHFDQELAILRGSISGNLDILQRAIESSEPLIVSPFSYDINNPRQEVAHSLAKLGASIYIGEQQFDLKYAFQRNIRKEFDVRRGSNNLRPAINLELLSQSIDLDWDHPTRGSWAGTYGVQLFTQDNNNIFGTNTIPFVPNFNTTNIGLFGIESYTSGNTTYEVGVRYDFLNMNIRGRDSSNDIYRDDVNFENFSYTFGIIKELGEHLTLQTNIGSSWRAPNVNELYAFGKHQNVFEYGIWRYNYFPANDSISARSVLSNEEKPVKSEQGLKWVTTLNYAKPKFTLELTPHLNWIKNYFFLRPFDVTETVRGTFPYFIHDQTNAIYSGIDLDLTRRWKNDFTTNFKVAYVYARDTENDQKFIGIPPLNIQASVKKQVSKLTFNLRVEYEHKQTNAPPVIPIESFNSSEPVILDRSQTFDFIDAPDGFFLLGASVEYKTQNLELQVRGDNLLNTSFRRYTDNLRYYADDAGRNLGLNISYKF